MAIISPEVKQARRLRQRMFLDKLDYARELRRLSGIMSQSQIARELGLKQPTIHSTLQSALSVADPLPGFHGASPYEIAQRHEAGDISQAQLIDELTRWDYAPLPHTDGYDDLLPTTPGSWNDVVRAADEGVIDGEVYDLILRAVAARLS